MVNRGNLQVLSPGGNLHLLSQLLRDARRRQGLTIAELADLAGLKRESLSRIETGKQAIGIGTLQRLADLITLPTSEWVECWLEDETRLRPLAQIARYLVDRGDLENASKVLRKIRGLMKLDRHGRSRGELYRQWGRYTYRMGQSGRALHWLRLAEQASHHSTNIHDKAIACYNYALSLHKARFIEGSLAKFNDAILKFEQVNSDIELGYALLSKANLLFSAAAYHEAVTEYRRAAVMLRRTPWLFECRLGEALCVSHIISVKAAFSMLGQMENLTSDAERRAKFHHNMGVFCRRLGMFNDARTHLSTALNNPRADQSDVAGTLAELCLCQMLDGDPGPARLTLKRFADVDCEKEPYDVAAMTLLSFILGKAETEGPPLPNTLHDNYEGRLAAAMVLLRKRVSQGGLH